MTVVRIAGAETPGDDDGDLVAAVNASLELRRRGAGLRESRRTKLRTLAGL